MQVRQPKATSAVRELQQILTAQDGQAQTREISIVEGSAAGNKLVGEKMDKMRGRKKKSILRVCDGGP